MRAYQVIAPGPPEVMQLVELPDPAPQEGEILVRVRAFGLNRSELYTRQGHSGDDVPFPRVLGIECVGEVVDAGGTDLRAGQTVCAVMGGLGRRYDGGYAEMTRVPRAQVMPVETTLPWHVLGGLPLTWFAAWLGVVDVLGATGDGRYLIRGGTSAAGLAAAGILTDLDATVIATTRSERKRPVLEAAGVNQVVIDDGAIADRVRELVPSGVDGVLELVGSVASVTDSVAAIRDGGRLCQMGMLADEWGHDRPAMPRGISYQFGRTEEVHADGWTETWQTIVRRFEEGRYRPNIFQVLGFDEVVAAHRMMEANRAAGKLVVVTGETPGTSR